MQRVTSVCGLLDRTDGPAEGYALSGFPDEWSEAMAKSEQQVNEFVRNANANKHEANDKVVRDQDTRDEVPVIIDAEK